MNKSLEPLQQRLGYTFRNPELLREALTHPSYGHENRRTVADNQRLEFLGDAVLQLVVTQKLFQRLPNHPEGELTAMRARVVNRFQMQTLAEELKLGEELVLGWGEENNSGRTRGSNLSDAMEAVIGAIYIDGGWEVASAWTARLLEKTIENVVSRPESMNPKGDLQELLQVTGEAPPQYTCISEEGPPHARRFEVKVEWQGRELGRGQGQSKKEAEINAARAALEAHNARGSESATSDTPS